MDMRRTHRICLASASVVALATLALSGLTPERASSQCFPSLNYGGRAYHAIRAQEAVPRGRYVGRGEVPVTCNDTFVPDQPPPPPRYDSVDVYRARSLD